MNTLDDQFLYARQQTPRKAFADSLYRRLNTPVKPPHVTLRRLALTFATVWALFLILLAASPEVRAQIEDLFRRHILNYGNVKLSVVSEIGGQPGNTSPRVDNLSIEEAQKIIPFKLPQWMPEGFVQKDGASIIYYSGNDYPQDWNAGLKWSKITDPDDTTLITLSVWNRPEIMMVVGEQNIAREVDINDSQGVIYSGEWIDGSYVSDYSIHVVWTLNGLTYFLSSTVIPESDLTHIAESIR